MVAAAPVAPAYPIAFAPHQLRWIESNANLMLWRKSRRIGADYCDAYKRVSLIFRGRGLDVNYTSNKESNAALYIKYVEEFAKVFRFAIESTTGIETIGDEDILTFRVTFPSTPARKEVTIRAMSSNPNAARGLDGDFVLSELAWHKDPEEMYAAAAAATTLGGNIAILSSVNYEGDYFEQLTGMARRSMDPQTHGEPLDDDMEIELHETSIHDAANEAWGTGRSYLDIINRTRGKDYTPESFLREIRKKNPASKFPREFELIPDGESNSYFPWTTVKPAINDSLPHPIDLTRPADQQDRRSDPVWRERANEQLCQILALMNAVSTEPGRMDIGVDVGRTEDKFCVGVGRKIGERVSLIGMLRWRGMTFADMQWVVDQIMEWKGEKIRRVTRLCSDSTGLGMQLAEHWEREHPGRAEGITFNNSSMEVLATHARSMFDMSLVSIPNEPELTKQINSIRMERTASNKPRFAGERDSTGHADGFWSLALMLHAADSKVAQARSVGSSGGLA